MKKPVFLAEIFGPYGPVSIPERVLQKIWWRGDFRQSGLRTISGKPVRRVRAGRWNHNEGPDFIGSELEVDGKSVLGDVEVHFYAEDWLAHGHAADPAFDNVVLHVLMFPPRQAATPLPTVSGRLPETLVLLPYLNEDIDEYANRDALLALESREKSGWHEILAACEEVRRLALLREKAASRWAQKTRFAAQRLEKHGWAESCHQLVLETLGLKRNRAPMSALALKHPLAAMRGAGAEALFAEQHGAWHLSGLRPANHPLRRLKQYLAALAKKPDWPDALAAWGAGLAECSAATTDNTARFRKTRRFSATAKRLRDGVLAGAVGGTRLNTLAVDALLPLLAAHGVAPEVCAQFWFHWELGDVPSRLARDLRSLLPPENEKVPAICNGLFQGLLQMGSELG
ncbi:MAG: DUF2851 family protein [Puniceicoccales bacterium]|jgi:hypothetical protein|nr:DUF2851 family protein [Puniceicoccales bacterium]